MEIRNAIMTQNPCYLVGRTIRPKGLMLHSVGCSQPNAEVFYRSWNNRNFSSACVHAFIDANTGDVWQTLPWDRRGWHCGGSGNDTHIGVEMCEPESIRYTSGSTFTCSDIDRARAQVNQTYRSAVQLFAKLCEMFGFDPLADGVIVSHREGYGRGIATNHGDPEHLWDGLQMGYTMDRFRQDVAAEMTEVVIIYDEPARPTGTTAASLASLSNDAIVAELGRMAKEDSKKSGILASITCAQAILESGYVRSELAVQANNLFGMKASLSGNTWPSSAWDKTSVYSKTTMEYYSNGFVEEIQADFRRYQSLEESMADHSAYLLGAQSDDGPRYKGLSREKDFERAATILLEGGYATDPAYPAKLKKIRDMWNLSALDGTPAPTSAPVQTEEPQVYVPFVVKVSITDLRIRSGPGTQYEFRQYIPRGIYTIVEVRGNWGQLKSGAGWICLDYTARMVQ